MSSADDASLYCDLVSPFVLRQSYLVHSHDQNPADGGQRAQTHRPPVHLCCCRPVLMGFFFARIVDPSPCCQPYLLRLFRPILRAYLASPVVRVHAKHPSQWHWQDIGNSQSRFSNRRHPFLETRLGGKQKRNANSARMLTTHIADYDVGHVLWQRVPESEKMTRNGPYLAGGAGSVCFLSSR